ncbi:hypothetical protein BJ508DRAFT_374955 [Ascobolus immersus RN42]|uniref:Uncharacterized protein n=1 Tax=Ascobolus immersus RN42 TaxID=1160509 RepID=A0A3N4IHT9_ASCIM|nr:hypothetical protein BJ508DRAFT_374955 [Ascobolus immersus RN42]
MPLGILTFSFYDEETDENAQICVPKFAAKAANKLDSFVQKIGEKMVLTTPNVEPEPELSEEDIQVRMADFRRYNHEYIQAKALHSEYIWENGKIVILCPQHLTVRELGIGNTYCNEYPYAVRYCSYLSGKNLDESDKLSRRMVNDGLELNIPFAERQKVIDDVVAPNKEYLEKLQTGCFVFSRICDVEDPDEITTSLLLITTDWENTPIVEMVLHGKTIAGFPVYVIRDTWMPVADVVTDVIEDNVNNAWNGPPLMKEIMVGASLGDKTASALFHVRKGRNEPYLAMIQNRHGFENTEEDFGEPQALKGPFLLDPGPTMINKTIRYLDVPEGTIRVLPE